jgi:hypothetical protein
MDILYGNLLFYRSLRVGFPSAQITVYDNCSVPGARLKIEEFARVHGCGYVPLVNRVMHWEFIQSVVEREWGPVVIMDPDVCLWENMERLDIGDSLYGGRYIPRFRDEFTHTLTHGRVHPSFLLIPDCEKLRNEVNKLKGQYWFFSPYQHMMYCDPDTDEWTFHDTAGFLYSALKENVYVFGEEELNRYDHLFQGVGPCFKMVADSIKNDEDKQFFINSHELAKGPDYKRLKGIWRRQEQYFMRRAVNDEGFRIRIEDR